jgi:Ca-activated chloride channel family protein
LKDEVVQLGKEYGIMTPYTSYLVLESDEAYRQNGIPMPAASAAPEEPAEADASGLWISRREGAGGREIRSRVEASVAAPKIVPIFGGKASDRMTAASPMTTGSGKPAKYRAAGAEESKLGGYFRRDTGSDAVKLSQAIGDYKTAEHEMNSAAVRHVGEKTFTLLDGAWVDSSYTDKMKAIRVKFGSDDYFKLLSDKPDLRQYLALGEKVIVALDDDTAVIVEQE